MVAPRKLPPKEVGAPGWVVTFADLATLLLTFFVLLLSFSNNDVIKFREMLGSVQSAFGVKLRREGDFQGILTGNQAKEEKKKQEKEDEKLKRQLIETKKSLQKVITENKLDNNTSIIPTKRGMRIRIKGKAVFPSGSAAITPAVKKLLDRLSRIIRSSNFTLTIEGHSDNIPLRKGGMYLSNWELSGIRAASIARYLTSKGVAPSRLKAAGYGDMRPISSNIDAEGRSENRRVEFLIIKPPALKN